MKKGIKKSNDIYEWIDLSIRQSLTNGMAQKISVGTCTYTWFFGNDFHAISTDDILMECVHQNVRSKNDLDIIILEMMTSGKTCKVKKDRVAPIFVPQIMEDSGCIFCYDYIFENQMVQFWDFETRYRIEKSMELPYVDELKEIAFENLKHMNIVKY